jgi:acetyl esterase
MYEVMFAPGPDAVDPTTLEVAGTREMIPTRDGEVRVLVYTPELEPDKKLPVYFAIHGGGFVSGDAENIDFFCEQVCEELGILVVNINYRLAPEFPYPAAVNDCYDVVDYFVKNADKYNLDVDNMTIGGDSAGANLSTVTCIQAKESGAFNFKAQILAYPPTDLKTNALDKKSIEGAIPIQIALIFDSCYFSGDQGGEPYISPVYASDEQLIGLPPAVAFTAETDSLCDEGELYFNRLAALGNAVTFKRFIGAAHGFAMVPDDAVAVEAKRYMIDGIRYYIGK